MRTAVGVLGLVFLLAACTAAPKAYATGSAPQPGTLINGTFYPALENGRKPKTVVSPLYPEDASHRQIEGFVDFEFVIQPDGSVANPKVTREVPEHKRFAKNAEKVFDQFTFAPDVVDGMPVATPARYRMVFKLHP